MAAFDPADGKIVLRVVYDGPAYAGKTTNLKALCSFFTTRRRSEIFSVETATGRTAYLDWLQVDGGVVAGHSMRCQLITVPGQAVLSHRRRHLLRLADVVVFVADSEPVRMTENRLMAGELREFLAKENRVPFVVQANKQDAPRAFSPSELLRELGFPENTPVSAANALSGAGVRETLILAVRSASHEVQRRVMEAGPEALEKLCFTGEELKAQLAELEAEQSGVERVFARYERERELAETPRDAAPPLPDPDKVASGLIWPSTTGRETLRRVPLGEAIAHRMPSEESGSKDVIYEAGIWCMKTSLERRFPSFDDARAALVDLARKKVLLGGLLVRNTVLVVSSDAAGNHWLWTVAPWLASLRSVMTHAVTTGDLELLRAGLKGLAAATLEAMQLAARHRLVLDVLPSNFALWGERTYYLGDAIGVASSIPAIGHALLGPVDDYSRYAVVSDYIAELERDLGADVSREDREILGLRAALEETVVESELAQDAKRRFLRALEEGPP